MIFSRRADADRVSNDKDSEERPSAHLPTSCIAESRAPIQICIRGIIKTKELNVLQVFASDKDVQHTNTCTVCTQCQLREKKYEKRFLLEVLLKEDGGYLIRCAHIAASIALNDES